MIELSIHDGSENSGEQVLTREPCWILEHDYSKFDELPEEELVEPIFKLEVSISHIDLNLEDHRVKIALIVKLKVARVINIQTLDGKIDITFITKDPRIGYHMGRDLPMFKSWKVKPKKAISIVSWFKIYSDNGHIKFNRMIFNILECYVPF